MALLATGCSLSTIFHIDDASRLHQGTVLVLESTYLAPTGQALHERVVERIEAGLQRLEEAGPVHTRADFAALGDVSLEARNAYERFGNTLSLTGVPDPELSHILAREVDVDLLAQAQVVFLPCSTCELGDQMWLVGQVVEADTGTLLFRAHLRQTVFDADAEGLQEVADDLTESYLTDLRLAFRLRHHRARFENLKRRAGT